MWCEWLLDLFCPFTPYQDNGTPLFVASQNGHHGVVQILLGAGADTKLARTYDVCCGIHVTCHLNIPFYLGGTSFMGSKF